MYKVNKNRGTTLEKYNVVEGETIETKIERIVVNKEPITDGAPLMYTERKEGVKAGTNIRTDRFEIALDAMDKVNKSISAKRDAKMEIVKDEKPAEDAGDIGDKPVQGNA